MTFESDFEAVFLSDRPLIDVRAPIEYGSGSLPGSVNLPLLTDIERHEVGIAYKQQGPAKAIELGERLVSGPTREARVRAWSEYVRANETSLLYCFRGGLRSTSVARAIRVECGLDIPVLTGGYKAGRGFLRSTLEAIPPRETFLVISGQTGSGKTALLHEFSGRSRTLDLEGIARHRGSAFGHGPVPQPSAADFENHLAAALLKTHRSSRRGPILIEDESRLIGRLTIPSTLFAAQQTSPLVVIEEPIQSRVERLLSEYLADVRTSSHEGDNLAPAQRLGESLRTSLAGIERRLGGARVKTCREMMEEGLRVQASTGDISRHGPWVEFLLREYYDVVYDRHIAAQQGRIAFRGTREAVIDFLNDRLHR